MYSKNLRTWGPPPNFWLGPRPLKTWFCRWVNGRGLRVPLLLQQRKPYEARCPIFKFFQIPCHLPFFNDAGVIPGDAYRSTPNDCPCEFACIFACSTHCTPLSRPCLSRPPLFWEPFPLFRHCPCVLSYPMIPDFSRDRSIWRLCAGTQLFLCWVPTSFPPAGGRV